MVEICSCPNASYSTESICCGVTPSRARRGAIDDHVGFQTMYLLVAVDVLQLGNLRSLCRSRGAHS